MSKIVLSLAVLVVVCLAVGALIATEVTSADLAAVFGSLLLALVWVAWLLAAGGAVWVLTRRRQLVLD